MSLEERKVALESDFGRSFHISAAEHVTWIFWTRDTNEPTEILGQASAFMLDRAHGPILIKPRTCTRYISITSGTQALSITKSQT